MFHYIIFEQASGKIVAHQMITTDLGEGVQQTPFPELLMMPCGPENPVECFVQDGKIVPRPALQIRTNKLQIKADGIDEAILTGFPVPCEIEVDGQSVLLEEDGLTITSDTPASYQIKCSKWPYLDWAGFIGAGL